MKIRVLGSGAGGGFPQWNCNCHNCHRLRHKEMNGTARTQSSIAVSTDNLNWLLFNTSPDIRAQLEAFPAIQPKQGVRDTGIKAIMLIDSQIDHTTGLLMLREGKPLDVYCTEMVKQDLSTGFPLFKMLEDYCTVNHHPIPFDGSSFTIPGIDDLRFYTQALKSKAPPYSPHRHDPHDGDNIGVIIEQISTGKNCFIRPAWARSKRMYWRLCKPSIACWWTAPSGPMTKCASKTSATKIAGNRPFASIRSRRHDRSPERSQQSPQDFDPHQQHQSDLR
jgi:Metal-dependent hydrolases of the beta-lactamase superfamily I